MITNFIQASLKKNHAFDVDATIPMSFVFSHGTVCIVLVNLILVIILSYLHISAQSTTSQPIKMSHNYKTELFIPIRRHHGDFDDFFRSRWLEHNQSSVDSEMERRRKEWDAKLEAMKSDFFHFSPFNDHHPHIESTRALQPVSL